MDWYELLQVQVQEVQGTVYYLFSARALRDTKSDANVPYLRRKGTPNCTVLRYGQIDYKSPKLTFVVPREPFGLSKDRQRSSGNPSIDMKLGDWTRTPVWLFDRNIRNFCLMGLVFWRRSIQTAHWWLRSVVISLVCSRHDGMRSGLQDTTKKKICEV
jgi:hypothetical protein